MKKYEFRAKQYKRHIGRIVGVCYRYVALPAREGDSGSRHLGGRNRSNVDGYTLSKKKRGSARYGGHQRNGHCKRHGLFNG